MNKDDIACYGSSKRDSNPIKPKHFKRKINDMNKGNVVYIYNNYKKNFIFVIENLVK